MFNFFKKLITPAHRHIEKIPIHFKYKIVLLSGGPYWRNYRPQETAITCYLHTCPTCGETLEYGKNAKLTGQKFGNFYTLRTSLRLAQKIWDTQLEKKLMDLEGGSVIRFRKDHMSCWFEKKISKQTKSKVEQKKVDLVA